MQILKEKTTRAALQEMCGEFFEDMLKAVVDIRRGIIALNAEMHSDLEKLLLDNGSLQEDLWGINIFPAGQGAEFIVFDSLINIRPRQNNRSRSVESDETRKEIISTVEKWII
jgi:hypothetical protein